VISSALPTLHSPGRAERSLVALPTFGDLLIYAKDLFFDAKAPQAPGIKTFEIDQSFEPGARNRRLTMADAPVASVPGPVVGAGLPGLMAFAMLLLARYRKRRFA